MNDQQGSAVLGMTFMMLLLGAALLNTTLQHLSASLLLVADERQHIIDFHQAQSALTWGLRLRWHESETWQCQYERHYHWRACIRAVTAQRWLLRGESHATQPALSLWQWVKPAYQGQLTVLKHGWIDFCPLADADECDIDVK